MGRIGPVAVTLNPIRRALFDDVGDLQRLQDACLQGPDF